eukprot:scaffold25172_cov41-Phaeocystis_antarctica.AAC.2
MSDGRKSSSGTQMRSLASESTCSVAAGLSRAAFFLDGMTASRGGGTGAAAVVVAAAVAAAVSAFGSRMRPRKWVT